jgi:hypothetical protein
MGVEGQGQEKSKARMTNAKIQMTNQIQMIKCQNDSMKNPDQRSELQPLSNKKVGKSMYGTGIPH